MNTRDRIVFVTSTGKRTYDADLGEYVTASSTQEMVACDVSDVGIEQSIKLWGNYKDGRIIVHLLKPYAKKFDHVLYRGEKYKMISKRLNGLAYYFERDSATI